MLFVIAIAASAFSGFFIARKIFRTLKANSSGWAIPLSILSFLAVFFLIMYVIFIIVESQVSFGR